VAQGSRVLGGNHGPFLINDPAELLAVDLNGAIHILDNGVAAPLQPAESIGAEGGGATRSHSDYAHVALPVLVNRMRDPVRQTAVCREPVVGSAFRPAANHGNAGFRKAFPDGSKVIAGNLGIGVHQADIVVAPEEFGDRSRPSQTVGPADIFRAW